MRTIFSKEIKSYFNSFSGYLFLAMFLVSEGLYHYIYNYVYASADYPYTLEASSLLLIFFLPVICVRIFAHERKLGTDRLLMTSPVSTVGIVLAKYFAAFTLVLAGSALISFHPFVMSEYGEVNLRSSYWALFVFVLFAAAMLAVGMFISSLFSGELVAGIVTFACMMFVSLLDPFIEMLRGYGIELPVGVSPLSHLHEGLAGRASLGDVVYFLILVLIFITATVISLSASRKDRDTRTKLAITGFYAGLALIGVALNLLVAALDIHVDLTAGGLYSLEDTTVEYLESLKDHIVVTYITGENEEEKVFSDIMEGFTDVCDNIEYVVALEGDSLALVKNKNISSQFGSGFLVTDEDTGLEKFIDIGEMIISTLDYSTLSYKITGVDLEGRMLSALSYVQGSARPKVKLLTGHGEEELASGFVTILDREGIDHENVSLSTSGTLEGCDALVIYAPISDISEEEYNTILEYLLDGGKIMIFADPSAGSLPNIESLMRHYGIDIDTSEIVQENDGEHYLSGNNLELLPDLCDGALSSDIRKGSMIVCPYASPLYIRSNISDKLTVTPILATSEDSVALRYDQDTDSEVKTADGPFYLGIKSRETYDDGYSEMIVYSDAYIVSDMFLWNGPYANERLAVASIRELTPYQSPVLAPVKNVENGVLAVTSQESTLIGVLYIGLFPAAILILGGLNLIRRRNSARRQ
ncbi:MAG: Gldg family protein [Lachnospiraceae bacterium]|nr:Gldg family protein [Lachnospiraceae bacterium]